MAVSYVHQQFSMFERLRGSDPSGKKMLPIVEAINQNIDDFLKDMYSVQANMGLWNRTRVRNSIPTPSFGQFYRGTSKNSTTTRFIPEHVCEITDRSEVDCRELDTIQNGKEERTNIVKAFLQGMGQKIVDLSINGGEDATTGQHVKGLLERLNSLQVASADRKNVITAGGSSNLTAILLVEWGPQAYFCIYPPGYVKNATYGVTYRNEKREKVYDDDDKPYYAYVDTFSAWLGNCCADELKIAAVVNVDSTATFNEDLIIKLLNRCKFRRGVTRIYCNEIIRGQIEIRGKDKANILWGTNELFGREVTTLSGGAILRTVDSEILGNDLTAVT